MADPKYEKLYGIVSTEDLVISTCSAGLIYTFAVQQAFL